MIPSIGVRINDNKVEVYKDPFFSNHYNVTTYDSYLWSFYVCPITEIDHEYTHYDVGFLMTTSGIVTLDEVHLIIATEGLGGQAEEEYDKLLSVTSTAVKVTSSIGGHVLLTTATMPVSFIKFILEQLKGSNVLPSINICGGEHTLIYYKELSKLNLGTVKCYDITKDYSSACKEYIDKVKTSLSTKYIINDLKDVISHPNIKNVLIVCNTVRRAVSIYNKIKSLSKLKGYDVYLIPVSYTHLTLPTN